MPDRMYLGTVLDQNNEQFKAIVSVSTTYKSLNEPEGTSHGEVRDIALEGEYLYCSDGAYLEKRLKNTLALVTESAYMPATPTSIKVGANGIFTGSFFGDYKTRKFDKNTLALLATSENIGSVYAPLLIDDVDNVLYVCNNSGVIYKLRQSDLVSLGYFSNGYGATIRSTAQDASYIYVGGDDPSYVGGYVKRFNKLNMSQAPIQSPALSNGAIQVMAMDDAHIYVWNSSSYKLYKLAKTDLSLVLESTSTFSTVKSMFVDNDYLYIGGWGDNGLKMLNKSTLAIIHQSIDMSYCYGVCADDTYIYSGSDTGSKRLHKILKTPPQYYNGNNFVSAKLCYTVDAIYQITGYRRVE